jgi:glucosamine--fructose-6-phosphate aminotransferase (isomerizing)
MCGIVGNITNKPIKNMLMNGLTELEYRGYDGVGIAIIEILLSDPIVAIPTLS